MATKRAAPVRGVPTDGPMPTPDEVHDAIQRWRVCVGITRAAMAEETDARTALVDVLHRAGLRGFSL